MAKAKDDYVEFLDTLYKSTQKGNFNITQIAFQELVGKLEVLGELLIKHK